MMSWNTMFSAQAFLLIWITCNAAVMKETESTEKTPFELDEFFNSTFSASGWNGSWLTDTEFLFKNKEGDILKYDLLTKLSETFLEASVLTNYSGASITVSDDQTYILIRYNVSSVFRHSTTALFTVYDIQNKEYYHINNQSALQLATFAPTGHGVAYVYNNNIFYLSNANEVENPQQVTTDGEVGLIYCGVPDWVYEEEVLGTGSALWFSPDAKQLAYATFNDTHVANFSYFVYGTAGDIDDQYPTIATIKYPKVGTANPMVNIFVYNIAGNATTEFELPDLINKNEENNDYILYDLTWVSDTQVAMISTNRIQSKSLTVRCDLDGSCEKETGYEQAGGWLSPEIPVYSVDGKTKIEILPQPVDNDLFDHIVLTDIENNTTTRLTYGNRVVTGIYGWQESKGLIYYTGSVNGTPSQQHIYVVNVEDQSDKCLTCEFIVDDEKCERASASFSKSFSYYIKTCTGPNPSYVQIQSLSDENDTLLWEDNAELREKLLLKLRPVIKNLEVPIEGNFTARVRLLLPPKLDETAAKKYNAVVYTYAGPNSNAISDAYSSGVQNYFVTNREYIYIYIDGRGSGRDGKNKMFQVYRNLATVETEDQIAVTKYLKENLPYINQTGIWGWSYGGFNAAWALIKDTENVFKFALSVAPVTSFIYYDTIYTERYMGLPTEEDNLAGYNNTDITRNVEAMRGKLYFLIHGNADDNVHYQQAMLLSKALEQADIAFRQQSYPDENHSLSHVYKHLYHTIDLFWARCFGVEYPTISVWKKSNF